MATRPDYVACIAIGAPTWAGRSWCGRSVSAEWAFTDASHAALNGKLGGRMVPCAECAREVAKALGADGEVARLRDTLRRAGAALREREWLARHAAENSYCPDCNNADDTWRDQSQHHGGCAFAAVMRELEG